MDKISIIIPVLNEEKIIKNSLLALKNETDIEIIEIIVVDGGSKDKTVEYVQELGIKVLSSHQLGRAYQMNLGASKATGNILLFLHADTYLPMEYTTLIRETLEQPQIIAGAFELSIDSKGKLLRLVEKMVNWRSRFLSLPYGDQALFLKASVFKAMQGFPNLPIMEDFELIQRLKKQGKIAIVPAKVITSGRRWQKFGIINTTLINQLIIVGYYLGIPLSQLARLYGRKI